MELKGQLIEELQITEESVARLQTRLSGVAKPSNLYKVANQELADELEHLESVQDKINELDRQQIMKLEELVGELWEQYNDPTTTPGESLDIHGHYLARKMELDTLRKSYEQRVPKTA